MIMRYDPTDPRTLNMDRVCEIVRGQGVPAYVEMTGGNVATIYAGEPYTDGHGDGRYPAIAGPGSFSWSDAVPSMGDLRDFYVGPDDDGAAGGVSNVADYGAVTAEQVAAVIVAQATRADVTQPLTAEEVAVLGLDPTGRSMPADWQD